MINLTKMIFETLNLKKKSCILDSDQVHLDGIGSSVLLLHLSDGEGKLIKMETRACVLTPN